MPRLTNHRVPGPVHQPGDRPLSSARAYIEASNDGLASVEPLLSMVDTPWEQFIATGPSSGAVATLLGHEHSGRSPGDSVFVEKLEQILGRRLRRNRPGRGPRTR